VRASGKVENMPCHMLMRCEKIFSHVMMMMSYSTKSESYFTLDYVCFPLSYSRSHSAAAAATTSYHWHCRQISVRRIENQYVCLHHDNHKVDDEDDEIIIAVIECVSVGRLTFTSGSFYDK
jgi:hypothetical protein